MIFKRGLLAAVLAGLGLMMGSAQAQDMTFFRIGTGGAGGTYYPIGGLIANAISTPRVHAPATRAAVAVCQDWSRSRYRLTLRWPT